MAASTTHNVTPGEVLGELPVQTSKVTATSTGANTTKIERWIDHAAGQLNAMLRRHGIDPTQLGDDESETIRAGILAYAAAKVAPQIGGVSSEEISRLWETWGSVRKTARDNPQDLGADEDPTASVSSNIDTDSPTSSKWNADGFGGW
jgi:hypothetical protein